jgi:hypothetical protein
MSRFLLRSGPAAGTSCRPCAAQKTPCVVVSAAAASSRASRLGRTLCHASSSSSSPREQQQQHSQQQHTANTWTANHSGLGVQDPAAASRVAKYKRIMLKVSGEALQGE